MEAEEQINSIINLLTIDLDDCENLKVACFPIFMTVSSGIDFIGGLIHEQGFGTRDRQNSGPRYKLFLKEYMSKIKPIYSDDNFNSYLYNFLRSKITHEICINGDLYTENYESFIPYHLKFYCSDNKFRIYLHPLEFKKDFLKALKLFLIRFNSDSLFKAKAIHRFADRSTTIELEVQSFREHYPFSLEQTEYVSSDGTNYKMLRIEENK